MIRQHWSIVAIGILSLTTASIALTADEVAETKPSTYAASKDLIAQVNFYLERLTTDLEDASAYGEEQQDRVIKDANTLAVLGTALGLHDEQHDLKAGAPALTEAAKELAKNSKDHAKASEALKKAQAALEVKSGGGKVAWEGAADLSQLMKQVPIVNNSLRQGVTGQRFARLKEKTAQTAATLAALAEASAHDTSFVSDEADTPQWVKISREMRDSSAAIARMVRAGDQAGATKELDVLVKTCDDCHHKFRD
jgi:hypothetical protein